MLLKKVFPFILESTQYAKSQQQKQESMFKKLISIMWRSNCWQCRDPLKTLYNHVIRSLECKQYECLKVGLKF